MDPRWTHFVQDRLLSIVRYEYSLEYQRRPTTFLSKWTEWLNEFVLQGLFHCHRIVLDVRYSSLRFWHRWNTWTDCKWQRFFYDIFFDMVTNIVSCSSKWSTLLNKSIMKFILFVCDLQCSNRLLSFIYFTEFTWLVDSWWLLFVANFMFDFVVNCIESFRSDNNHWIE